MQQAISAQSSVAGQRTAPAASAPQSQPSAFSAAVPSRRAASEEKAGSAVKAFPTASTFSTLEKGTVDVQIKPAGKDNRETSVLDKKPVSTFFSLHEGAASTDSSFILLPASTSLDDDVPSRTSVVNSQDNICSKIRETDSIGSVKLSQTCATNAGSSNVNSSSISSSSTSSSSLSNTASTSSNASSSINSAVAPQISLFLSCEDFCNLDDSSASGAVENTTTARKPEERQSKEPAADKKTCVDNSSTETEEETPDLKPSAGFGSSADKKFTLPPLSSAHENAFWVQTLERSGACTVLSQTSADIAAKGAPVEIPPDFGKSFNAITAEKTIGRCSKRANSVDIFAGGSKISGGTHGSGSGSRTFGSSAELQRHHQAEPRRLVGVHTIKSALLSGKGKHSTFQADSARSIVPSPSSIRSISQTNTSVRLPSRDVAAFPLSKNYTCYGKKNLDLPLAAGATVAGTPTTSNVRRAFFHRASIKSEKRVSVVTACCGGVSGKAEALKRVEENVTTNASQERYKSTTTFGTAATALGVIGICRVPLLHLKHTADADARPLVRTDSVAGVSRAKQRTLLKHSSHSSRAESGTEENLCKETCNVHVDSPCAFPRAQIAAHAATAGAELAEGAAPRKSAASLPKEATADERAATTASPSGCESSTSKASTTFQVFCGEKTRSGDSRVLSLLTLKQQSKEFVQRRYLQAKSLIFPSSPFEFTHSSAVTDGTTLTAIPTAAEVVLPPSQTTAAALLTTPTPLPIAPEVTVEEATVTAEKPDETTFCSVLTGTLQQISNSKDTAAKCENGQKTPLETEARQPVAAAATPPAQEAASNEDNSLKSTAEQPASAGAESTSQKAETKAPVSAKVDQLTQRYCFRALTPPCHLCSGYAIQPYAQQQRHSNSGKTMQFAQGTRLSGVNLHPNYPAGPGWITPPFSPRYSPVQQLHETQQNIHRQQQQRKQQQLPIASLLPVSTVSRRETMGILPPTSAAKTTHKPVDTARGTSNNSNRERQRIRGKDASRRHASECYRSRAVMSSRIIESARSPASRPGSVNSRQKTVQPSPSVGRRPRSVTPSPAVWRSRSRTAAGEGALASRQRHSDRMLLANEKDDLPGNLRGRGSSRSTRKLLQSVCNGARDPPIICHACGVLSVPSQHSKDASASSAIFANSDSRKTPPLCGPCREKKELIFWKQITDWRSIINDVGFLSLQKHYKYELPNQHDSAAFSLHNKVEKRIFFAIMHTNEPASSHLPVGWRMFLYLPNPAVQKDLLNVLDPKSDDAFTVIRADRPCGQSLLSYVTRTPIVVWESLHDREVKSYKQKLLGYIVVSRSPFVSLRVQNSQRHKVVEVLRLKKGSKKRRTPQEWMAYGLNREVPVARIVLFMDECKSIAGRDATIVFDDRVEATLKMFIVVCVCYIQFLSFGRCAGVQI